MVDLVEARRDVRLEHPVITAAGGPVVVDLGDRVLRPASWPEPVGGRLEVGFEDGFQNQFQRGLHDPVGSRGDAQMPDLSRRLGDRLLPYRYRGELPRLQLVLKVGEQLRGLPGDGPWCHAIDSGGSCAFVARDPVPRRSEEARVIDKVVEIIEATIRIVLRPTVQFRLHHQYPVPGNITFWPRSADIHQRPPGSALSLRTHWAPSPCGRLSRPRTTTGPPPHPGGINRRQVFPPTSRLLAGKGTTGMVPTFTVEPFDGVGAQLCPCSIATATPQAFTMASAPATSTGTGVPHPARWVRAANQPRSTRFELAGSS